VENAEIPPSFEQLLKSSQRETKAWFSASGSAAAVRYQHTHHKGEYSECLSIINSWEENKCELAWMKELVYKRPRAYKKSPLKCVFSPQTQNFKELSQKVD